MDVLILDVHGVVPSNLAVVSATMELASLSSITSLTGGIPLVDVGLVVWYTDVIS